MLSSDNVHSRFWAFREKQSEHSIGKHLTLFSTMISSCTKVKLITILCKWSTIDRYAHLRYSCALMPIHYVNNSFTYLLFHWFISPPKYLARVSSYYEFLYRKWTRIKRIIEKWENCSDDVDSVWWTWRRKWSRKRSVITINDCVFQCFPQFNN